MYNGQQAIIASSRPKISTGRVFAGGVLAVLGAAAIGMTASGKAVPAFWPEGVVLIASALFILIGICLLYRTASILNSEIILYDGGVRGRAVPECGSQRQKARYVDFDIGIADIQNVSWRRNTVVIKTLEKNLLALCDTEETARNFTVLIRGQQREEQLTIK